MILSSIPNSLLLIKMDEISSFQTHLNYLWTRLNKALLTLLDSILFRSPNRHRVAFLTALDIKFVPRTTLNRNCKWNHVSVFADECGI